MFRLTMLTVGLPLGLIFIPMGLYLILAESDWLITGGLAIMAGVVLVASAWNSYGMSKQ